MLKKFGKRLRSWRPGRCRPLPILTYHSANAHGYDYGSNDHYALGDDLALIRRLGLRVIGLREAVAALFEEHSADVLDGRVVAITFDDAPDWDYFDLIHPDVGGCLRSFYRILLEASDQHDPRWTLPTATSFVIASPEARTHIDRACLAGRGHWRDFWWYDAAASGVIDIANHSWDHAHAAVPVIAQRHQMKGTFAGIDAEQDADIQVTLAQRYIWYKTAGLALPYFAYPYGVATDYLSEVYLPEFSDRHGIVAAFDARGDYAVVGGSRWKIPRFVCGEHWKAPEDLERILRGAAS